MGMGTKSRPPMLVVAAVVLAAEALALLAYTVLTVIATATNQVYTVSSGVAQIVIQVIMLTGLALLASGVAKMRPWTRTPSVMVQILIGFVGVVLLQAHRYDWGVPTLLLAVAGFAGLMTPASLKALARPIRQPDQQAPKAAAGSQASKKDKPRSAGKSASPGESGTGKSGNIGNAAKSGNTGKSGTGNAAKSGNPAKRNPAGKPVTRRS